MAFCNRGHWLTKVTVKALSEFPGRSVVVGAVRVTRLGYADGGELLPGKFLDFQLFVHKYWLLASQAI